MTRVADHRVSTGLPANHQVTGVGYSRGTAASKVRV